MDKSTLVYLDDPSDFLFQSAGDFLKGDLDLAALQDAEMTAMSLREAGFYKWLEKLADELNSLLGTFEVRLVHLDTDNYLEFIPREPEEEIE